MSDVKDISDNVVRTKTTTVTGTQPTDVVKSPDDYLSLPEIVKEYGYKTPLSANASMRYANIEPMYVGNRVFFRRGDIDAYRNNRWEHTGKTKLDKPVKSPPKIPNVITPEMLSDYKTRRKT